MNLVASKVLRLTGSRIRNEDFGRKREGRPERLIAVRRTLPQHPVEAANRIPVADGPNPEALGCQNLEQPRTGRILSEMNPQIALDHFQLHVLSDIASQCRDGFLIDRFAHHPDYHRSSVALGFSGKGITRSQAAKGCRSAHDRVHTPAKSAVEGNFQLMFERPDGRDAAFEYCIAGSDERPWILKPKIFHHQAPIGHYEPPPLGDADAIQKCDISSCHICNSALRGGKNQFRQQFFASGETALRGSTGVIEDFSTPCTGSARVFQGMNV